MGPMGVIVIDYLMGNKEDCNIVEKIQVRHRTDLDHAVLEIKLEGDLRRKRRRTKSGK